MTRDGFTSPGMVRALLDATTATAGQRRKAHQRRSGVWPILVPLLVVAALAFLTR